MSSNDRLTLAKGFVMHKMHHYHCFCKKGRHGKHIAADNLPKGCPLELRPFVAKAINELKSEGLIFPKPTGYGEEYCAVSNKEGYRYANRYERYAELPVMEYGKPTVSAPKAPPLTKEQLDALKLRKK